MQTQINTTIDGYVVEIELDKHSEFCSAIKIVDNEHWYIFEFQLRDVLCEDYAEQVVWDYSTQQPKHVRIMEYDPYEQGFEYIEDRVKEFVAEQPIEKWKQLEL